MLDILNDCSIPDEGRREALKTLTGLAGAGTLAGRCPAVLAQSKGAETRDAVAPIANYPPGRKEMRGSHPGSFETMHALRDGEVAPAVADNGESFDLIVVGAGISGLSAAWFYKKDHPNARILILDNHDDFGGHAKRNEFVVDGRLILMNGGTLNIESPRPYSLIANGLLRSLDIDIHKLETRIQRPNFYASRGMHEAYFLDALHYGTDVLLRRDPYAPWSRTLQGAPLSVQTKQDIARLEEAHTDYLAGKSSAWKKDLLSRTSYRDFLQEFAGLDPDAVRFYQQRTCEEYCVGIDAVSALDCWPEGLPGFAGLDLAKGSIARMSPTAAGYADTGGSPEVHLPDGGATIARALVRSLIPDSIPGSKIDDLVTARVRYDLLDDPRNDVRIRLNSTVVSARNAAAKASADIGVTVAYRGNGSAVSVWANHCVMACWNAVIPHLCPDLPHEQKAALHSRVKAPLVYTNVAIANWQSFAKLGVFRIHAPAAFYSDIFLNEWTRLGQYRTPESPENPTAIRMVHAPCSPGLPAVEQYRAGRTTLLAMSYEFFVERTHAQLDAMLGSAGFSSARDVLAITVNRWPHGYAREYDPLSGPPINPGQEVFVIARRKFGAIAIANSDAGGRAYMDEAIDQAHRAVADLQA